MAGSQGRAMPVRAKVIIVDPGTMTVLWANEVVLEAPSAGSAGVGSPIEQVFPLAGQLGLGDAIARVAASGEAHHVHAGVIPTREEAWSPRSRCIGCPGERSRSYRQRVGARSPDRARCDGASRSRQALRRPFARRSFSCLRGLVLKGMSHRLLVPGPRAGLSSSHVWRGGLSA